MTQVVREGDRCPGCGVVCTPHAEHLNDCRFQGRDALVLVPLGVVAELDYAEMLA